MAEPASSSRLQDLIRRSVALHQSGRLDEAEALYRQVLKSEPGHADALNLLGVLIAQRGRPAEGVRLIRQAIAERPGVADFHCNLGHVERLGGDGAAAEAAYRAALDCQPANAAAARALGVMLADAGRLSDAEAVYRRVLAVVPDQPDLWFNLSTVLNQVGQVQEAEAALRRVVALRPGDVAAHGNLAMLMLKCARIDAAIEACRAGLAVAPENGALLLALGMALGRRGDHLDAAEAYRKARACDASLTGAHSGLIRSLRLAGQAEAAVTAGRQSAANPNAPAPIHAEIGLSLVELERFEEALAAFEAGVAKDPHQVTCYAEMGWLLRRLGREAEAERLLDFEKLAARRPVAQVPGYPSVESFNRDLAAYIRARSDLVGDLPETATQGGQQTSTLFSDAGPLPQALKALIEAACRDYVAQNRGVDGLPYFAAPPAKWRLNSNAVVLRSSGYQDAHMHPAGYVSGVYYVQIPDEVSSGDDQAGCLYFTDRERPAAEAGRYAQRLVRPEAGVMHLFPSYFWHGVMPFEGRDDRICVAFDAIPV